MDNDNNPCITSDTDSRDFPTVNAYHTTYVGIDDNEDSFIVKYSKNGETLDYAALIGGNDTDYARSIAITKNNNALITGYTRSRDFPVTPTGYNDTYTAYAWTCFILEIKMDNSLPPIFTTPNITNLPRDYIIVIIVVPSIISFLGVLTGTIIVIKKRKRRKMNTFGD